MIADRTLSAFGQCLEAGLPIVEPLVALAIMLAHDLLCMRSRHGNLGGTARSRAWSPRPAQQALEPFRQYTRSVDCEPPGPLSVRDAAVTDSSPAP